MLFSERAAAVLLALTMSLTAAGCAGENPPADTSAVDFSPSSAGPDVSAPADYNPPEVSAEVAENGSVTLTWKGEDSLYYEIASRDTVTGARTVLAVTEPGDALTWTSGAEDGDFSRTYEVTPFGSWEEKSTGRTAEFAGKVAVRNGFLLEDGYLRCYRGNEPVKSDYEGSLYFNRKGFYTCGDKELDGIFAALIEELTSPEMTRLEKFDVLYHHIANNENFEYGAARFVAFGTEDWEVESAKKFLDISMGNCFSFSATTMLCARALGFESRTVIGSCFQLYEWVDHCWTEVTVDGVTYLCDAEMEGIYAPNHLVEWDLFLKEYETTPTQYQIWEVAP